MLALLSIRHSCEELLGTKVQSIHSISGGDINEAYQLQTSGGTYFVKYNTVPFARKMFEAEMHGLALLRESSLVLTPEIVGITDSESGSLLLMEFIESGSKSANFWEGFGGSLAALHRQTRSEFGLDHNNFIGSLPQQNANHKSWTDFYISERLQPQLDMALQSAVLQSHHQSSFEKLYNKLDGLMPDEPAALTHGDLWSGNFLANSEGRPVLIDPAVSFAHREMDLAMSHLFGGFDALFYESYHAAYPLVSGFENRLDLYQLYYLMVHVNLFGGSYIRQVEHILERYV